MQLSPAKRRAFTIVTVLLPACLLALLEIALRTFDYGPNIDLFRTIDVAGRTYHAMNPDVAQRYFAWSQFNPATSHELFLVPKPKETFRIFVLGGSTVVGYPYWYNAAPSTFLRDRLRRIFPSRKIEVVNVGMTAINSFAVVDLARDLMRYEPDLLIVYDGHNEFYGALGVASRETVGGIRWVTRLYLKAIHLRTFLLLRDVIGRMAAWFGTPAARERTGTMMEQLARGQTVPYSSPQYERGLLTFQENLLELREVCGAGGVPLILSTQVSNLRGQPPFASGGAPGTTAEERSAFDSALSRGLRLLSEGKARNALDLLREAEALDSLRADTQFWIARCLDTLGNREAAVRSYLKARDYDQIRFRASTDFNEVIRQMGDAKTVAVADVEQAFAAASPDGIVDATLMFEHVHPRARGYFLMARAYQQAMRQMRVFASTAEWNAADSLHEDAVWEERPITQIDERLASRRNELLLSGWPFQPGDRKITPVSPDDTLGVIVEGMVTGRLSWESAHVAAAEYLEKRREFEGAALEYRTLVNQYPQNVSPYLRLARNLLALGRREEAAAAYRQSLEVEETPAACRALGKMANNDKRFPEAITWFRKAVVLGSGTGEEAGDRYNLVLVYINSRETNRAKEELRELLRRFPQYAPAKKLLQHPAGAGQ